MCITCWGPPRPGVWAARIIQRAWRAWWRARKCKACRLKRPAHGVLCIDCFALIPGGSPLEAAQSRAHLRKQEMAELLKLYRIVTAGGNHDARFWDARRTLHHCLHSELGRFPPGTRVLLLTENKTFRGKRATVIGRHPPPLAFGRVAVRLKDTGKVLSVLFFRLA